MHPFEASGCGVAPFEFIGVERRVGPIAMPGGGFVGSPGQPMGTCEHCGTGIAECCIIQDANGKRFIVGNVCVRKTGDVALASKTDAAVREAKRARKQEADMKRIAQGREIIKDQRVADHCAKFPHPVAFMAEKGLTTLDYYTWMLDHAGTSGALTVVRALEKVLEIVSDN